MDQAGPHDEVAIGLNEKGKQDGVPRAKVKNFKPRLIEGRLELSSFCVDQLGDTEVWELLDAHLNKPAIGRAQFEIGHFHESGLEHDPDWHPERHVNILGWPDKEEEQTSIAQVLYRKQVYLKRQA
ncbi:hypothetical protein [Stenotrophomonas pigmentata]|uniref:hypothetical protein n=1 Tax=Stenotrophomonas pigmentata TaxID=3055080 RepID=UPI0026F047EB|nr:hypothetical protein [Stenotrophomonas sp. 610A2]